MTSALEYVLILNALFFLFYGVQSLYSTFMAEEFKRFGLSDSQRKITGILQIIGSAGLIIGYISPLIGLLSAGGFTVMMVVAFIVRIKIKDSFIQSLPSIFFMLINGWISYSFYNLFW